MRSIQDVGIEILNSDPKKLYIFCGSEYGIKNRYLEMLANYYGETHEVSDIQSVTTLMNTKHFIPLVPALYIVRYDDAFISSLNTDNATKLIQTNIIGTLVCIYDDTAKIVSKLDKFLPDWVVDIGPVSTQFIIKYLRSDFPKLPDRLITIAAEHGVNYGDSQNICKSMMLADIEELCSLSDDAIIRLFGKQTITNDIQLRQGIASRNFNHLVRLLEAYPGDLDYVFYTILSTLVELEKILSNRYIESDLQSYVKRWTYKDIYNMFMNTYEELKKLRSYATNAEASLIYLFSLLQFTEIPDVEVMK